MADEYAGYLRSGVGRGLKTKEEVANAVFMPWLPHELVPAFMLRLMGDEDGWGEFRAVWITAVNVWFERMAEPYTPKKPAVAKRAVELFNAFVGAKFTYEELFPPPQKPETAKPAEAVKPEAAKPEAVKPVQKPAVEVQRLVVEERGLRREVVEKPTAEPEAAKPEAAGPEVGKLEAVKPEVKSGAGLRWVEFGERPRAPIADVIPERVLEAVDYLLERFGFVLDREAAFKAKSLVTAKVRARLEKVAVKEPEFAHLLAEVAERVLSYFGGLMASPDAARHVHEALFYYFEGYQTRDGELLFARIERTVREAVRKAEEAGIPDAEYRIKQFVLEVINVLARAGERYRGQALEGVLTVDKALRASAFAGLSAAALHSVYHGLYSEAVVSSVASAVALVEVGRFREAVEYVQKAAKALYEAAKEVFEQVRVTVQRLVELFVETVTRVLAWVDEHKAYLFLMAAVAAGVVALSVALNLWGLVELEKLAYAASVPPFFVGLADVGEKAAERFKALAERYEKWRVDENAIDEVLKAPLRGERPYTAFLKLGGSRRDLPPPLVELRRALARVEGEAEKDAAVAVALVLYKTLMKNAGAYGEWAGWYEWARGLVKEREFTVVAEEVRKLREAQRRLEEAAEEVRRELNTVLTLYASHSRDLYEKLKLHLEVDVKKAERLAEARRGELSKYSDAGMGTKAYAALLSAARGGLYGHVAMLLAGEGALADIVLSAPVTAYKKAEKVARGRGGAVDPSYSRRRATGWEEKAASALLRYLLGRAVDEDLKFRRVEGEFEVLRAYGGVEARVDALKIGEVASSKAGEEVLRRFVEEAKRKAPDLTGIKKIWQTLEWLNTDVSFFKKWIVAGTAQPWQLAWYIGLLGEGKTSGGGASVTEEGVKPNVTMRWRREVLDRIIAEEGKELEPLLGRPVKSWRELVDVIDWSWVLKKVEELADELKPWVGPEKMGDAEREDLVKRMFDELALIAHFAEARRGMDDGRWREERAARLARVIEALSGGRIAGEYADRLARAIIRYAEGYEKKAEKLIENLVKGAGVSREEVWDVVEFVLSDMYCLARDCARDEVVRKFVAPALELVMLDKALNNKFDREEALLLFGEMYATALAGDGSVGPREVRLTVGGELGRGAALLRLATLHLLNQLLPDGLKFNVRVYVDEGRYYRIAAYGEDAARFMRLLAVSAPSAGGGYLSPKFKRFVEEAQVEVQLDKNSIRLTKSGRVVADLTISEGDAAVKYNIYLRKEIKLQFVSTDRSRVELAARLLKLAGVGAEVEKEGGRDVWRVVATTDRLAAGREELRKALAEVVREAIARGWVDEKKAEGWLDKLERGRVLREGWPKYEVGLVEGALVVRYRSANPDNLKREVHRLREMGLEEGRYFTVKMPEGGVGYVSILREGLERAAWLSVYGSGEQQRSAAEFVEYILQRAKEAGEEVYEKAKEVVEEGKARGSLTLKGFEKKVEVEGREHVVKVIGGGAEFDVGRGGKKLLRLIITAEVDGVKGEYTITYGRRGAGNKAVGYAYAKADAPGGRKADAERLAAVIEALTGKKPKVYRRSDGAIMIVCGREHLDSFRRYAELADAIMKWLEETGR